MSGVTESVRKALDVLGINATDQQVKLYLRENDPTIPQSQISLVLRNLRTKAASLGNEERSRTQTPIPKANHRTLFPEH
jgi:hypothetical protein